MKKLLGMSLHKVNFELRFYLALMQTFQIFDIHKRWIRCPNLNVICNSNAFASRRRLQVHTRSEGMEEVYISVLIVKLLNCIICVYARTQQIFFIFHSVNAHRRIAQKNTRGRDTSDEWETAAEEEGLML